MRRAMSEVDRRLRAMRAAGIDTSCIAPFDLCDLPIVRNGKLQTLPNEDWLRLYQSNERVRIAYDGH